ncbi:NUDIX domain-containing protein [Occultella glacieicola]|uniref:NUDIX domain-containing protein n=1 Tax=Occultella glacieicola TaxID=2518684 RepID=A0ABY2E449_9MICO|nr:NUDIX domain-containing protein [Occultella glacieicola]TDE94805.1 NUDIX domain-containing protein [Occultella glacieicola]
MTGRFRVVPAAYVLLRRPAPAGEEVLLSLRRGTGYMDEHWAHAAAGHVEADESVHAAAVREAREELGITIAQSDLEPLCAMHRTHGNGRAIDERVDFFFSCHTWSGEPRLMEADKAAEQAWFPLDALPDPVVPHERTVLEAIRTDSMTPIMTFGFRAPQP